MTSLFLISPFFSFVFVRSTVSDTVLTRGQLAIARTSALLQAQKEPKPTPEKKTRGKKKASVKAATVDEE
jgi:hypothetical protein